MEDEFVVRPAIRQAVPMLISMIGPSGSGKTLSSILAAAGIAGVTGKVGMLDAENGRGALYADDPLVQEALPNGYMYLGIAAPYSPSRYVKGLQALENAGCTVAVIDSTSHEWEGDGGCTDIAENNKLKGMANWIMAKKEHKKFLMWCMSSPMHIIFCLRAREKTKVMKDERGKEQFVQMGIQPICEKNFVFEMLLSLMFDEATHTYCPIKVPKMLRSMLPGGELITKAHGEAIRKWADGGVALAPNELLQKRARSAAEAGIHDYQSFFSSLTVPQRKVLIDTSHLDNKKIAEGVELARLEGEAANDDPEADELKRIAELETK